MTRFGDTAGTVVRVRVGTSGAKAGFGKSCNNNDFIK